jgi:hypothetical protein
MFQRSAEMTIYGKMEDTYGVLAAPALPADVLKVFDVVLKALDGETERDETAQNAWGSSEIFHVGSFVSLEFKMSVCGAGAAGDEPEWGFFHKICGYAATVTALTDVRYSLISADGNSATVFVNVGGTRHPMTGVRGEVTRHFDAKKRPYWQYKLKGLWNAPVAKTVINPDFTGYQRPVPVGNEYTTASLHGTPLALISHMYGNNNAVEYIDVPGYEGIDINDREPGGDVTFLAPDIGVKDWFTTAKAGTRGPLVVDHGTGDGAGNHVRFENPNTQLIQPDYTTVLGGKVGIKANLNMLAGAATAGNDEELIIVS